MNRGAWQATVYGVAELGMTEQLNTHTHTHTLLPGLGLPQGTQQNSMVT